ncbi:MAG: FAD-binding oxidoreductase [Pseudomonadota bacterium]
MNDTIYARNARLPLPSEAPLPARTDVLVVGGGLTGLSAALHLTRSGFWVTLVDAGAIGDGASGRNGGQLHTGQRRDQAWLEKQLGMKMARALWRLGEEAIALIHQLRSELSAPCDYQAGLIEAAHTPAALDQLHWYNDHLHKHYGVTQELLDKHALESAIGTDRYHGGVRDGLGGHMNPLALVNAIAQAAHVEGARLHSGVKAVGHTLTARGWRVSVDQGGKRHEILAQNVILAGNGYMRGVSPYVEARVMPLLNHIVATAPLETPLIPGGEAVADSRYVIRYFRQDAQGRMVFGGGESFGRTPRNVARKVRPFLAEVYPALKNAPIEAAWSGTLGISRLRLPIIRRLEPGLYAGAGFSGQGLGAATFAGKVIADAVAGESSRLDVFGRVPAPAFPGGTLMRAPLAQVAMTWFAIRDRLGV